MSDIDRLRHDAVGRRAFLARMTAAGFGAAALTLLEARPAVAADRVATPARKGSRGAGDPFGGAIPGRTIDEQILNFALTLEILEADIYRQALNKASGKPLTDALSADSGDYSLQIAGGGLDGGETAAGFKYLVQFAYVEAAHRDFLKAAIRAGGGTPVAANPGGYTVPGGFSADLKSLLQDDILPLEETGVRAYLGALPLFTDLGLAQVAGTIYSTEARHSAAIEYIVGVDPGPTPMFHDKLVIPAYPSPNTLEYFLQPDTVLYRAGNYFVT